MLDHMRQPGLGDAVFGERIADDMVDRDGADRDDRSPLALRTPIPQHPPRDFLGQEELRS